MCTVILNVFLPWLCGAEMLMLMFVFVDQDSNQVLFGACGVSKCGDDQCSIPVVSLPYGTTCIYHMPVPDPIVSMVVVGILTNSYLS